MGDVVHISDLTRRITKQAREDTEKALDYLEEARRHLDGLEEKIDKHIADLEATLSRDSDTGGAA